MKSMEEYAHTVGDALVPALRSVGDIPQELLMPMEYSLLAGGKHLRGSLLLAVVDCMNVDVAEAIDFACGIELIHTYSLIHDDLPAMDNDDFRRGKPTCHKMYGDGMAVLAGDGLLSAACELMLNSACKMNNTTGIQAAKAIISRAGVCGMVAGQAKDITSSKNNSDAENVGYITAHKTADMLTAPMEAGMILAGADELHKNAAIRYGTHIGFAFQIVDDILDVTGSFQQLGKKTGMDENKQTWVSMYGIGKATEMAELNTAIAIQNCAVFDTSDGFFQNIARSLLRRVK